MAVKGWVFFCVAAGTFALYVEYNSASESARQEWIRQKECRERELMRVWNMQGSMEPCACSDPDCAFVPCLNMRMEEIKKAPCVS